MGNFSIKFIMLNGNICMEYTDEDGIIKNSTCLIFKTTLSEFKDNRSKLSRMLYNSVSFAVNDVFLKTVKDIRDYIPFKNHKKVDFIMDETVNEYADIIFGIIYECKDIIIPKNCINYLGYFSSLQETSICSDSNIMNEKIISIFADKLMLKYYDGKKISVITDDETKSCIFTDGEVYDILISLSKFIKSFPKEDNIKFILTTGLFNKNDSKEDSAWMIVLINMIEGLGYSCEISMDNPIFNTIKNEVYVHASYNKGMYTVHIYYGSRKYVTNNTNKDVIINRIVSLLNIRETDTYAIGVSGENFVERQSLFLALEKRMNDMLNVFVYEIIAEVLPE